MRRRRVSPTLHRPTLPTQLATLAYGHHPLARLRLRHVPGPPFIPFKGNIDFILEAGGLHAAYDAWSKKYGPVFKIFLGSEPVVVLTDAAAVRTSSLRLATRPPFRAPAELRFEKGAVALHAGDMLQTPSVRFHGELKKAWLPFFAAPSLRAHAPAIGALTDRLAERLTQAAREGA